MHRTAPPSHAGGNMDIRQLTAGTTLYLPVQVPGALFSVGDAHGAQGDGEVSGTGDRDAGHRHPPLRPAERAAPSASRNSSPPVRSPRAPTPAPTSPPPRTIPTSTAAARDALRGILDYLRHATASIAATPASSPAPASISASARSWTPEPGRSARSCRSVSSRGRSLKVWQGRSSRLQCCQTRTCNLPACDLVHRKEPPCSQRPDPDARRYPPGRPAARVAGCDAARAGPRAAWRSSGEVVVSLDDDPTGVQTVHGIRALIEPTGADIEQEFRDADTLFAILINTRAGGTGRASPPTARSPPVSPPPRRRPGGASA